MQLSRRKLAAVLASATTLRAQQPPPAPADADPELKIARDRLQANARALAAANIPVATEPAFQFKA